MVCFNQYFNESNLFSLHSLHLAHVAKFALLSMFATLHKNNIFLKFYLYIYIYSESFMGHTRPPPLAEVAQSVTHPFQPQGGGGGGASKGFLFTF